MSRLVLLVDDDLPTTRFMRLSLDPDEFAIEVVDSRDRALEVLADLNPDAIVMDYMMSGPPPDAFIEQVRATGFAGPILLCTAMHQDLDLAVDDVLRKPFDPDELGLKLRTLLGPSSD